MTTTRILPQRHCRDTDDHPSHNYTNRDTWRPTADALTHRCPGRFTPRLHGVGIVGDPQQPADPFAGIPED